MKPTIRFQLTLVFILSTLLTLVIVGGVILFLAANYTRDLGRSYMALAAEELNAALEERARETQLELDEVLDLISNHDIAADISVKVFDASGILLFDKLPRPTLRARGFPWVLLQGPPGSERSRELRNIFQTRAAQARQRMASSGAGSDTGGPNLLEFSVGSGQDGFTVQLDSAQPLLAQLYQAAASGFAIAAILAFFVAGVAGVFSAGRLSKPILRLSRTIAGIEPDSLTHEPDQLRPDLNVRGVSREIYSLQQGFHDLARRIGGLYSELRQERDSLRAFLADASHEIRTPLMAAHTFLDLLESEYERSSRELDAAMTKEHLGDLRRQLDRIQSIISGLLNLARLESGVMAPNLSVVNPGEVLNPILQDLVALNPDLESDIRIQGEEVRVIADFSALHTVFQNIVENAYRYAAIDGKLTLDIEFARENLNGSPKGRVRISIKDQGPGMDADEIGRAGERFFRGKSGQESRRGLGIGLAAATKLVELMDGDLRFSSPGGFQVDCFLPGA